MSILQENIIKLTCINKPNGTRHHSFTLTLCWENLHTTSQLPTTSATPTFLLYRQCTRIWLELTHLLKPSIHVNQFVPEDLSLVNKWRKIVLVAVQWKCWSIQRAKPGNAVFKGLLPKSQCVFNHNSNQIINLQIIKKKTNFTHQAKLATGCNELTFKPNNFMCHACIFWFKWSLSFFSDILFHLVMTNGPLHFSIIFTRYSPFPPISTNRYIPMHDHKYVNMDIMAYIWKSTTIPLFSSCEVYLIIQLSYFQYAFWFADHERGWLLFVFGCNYTKQHKPLMECGLSKIFWILEIWSFHTSGHRLGRIEMTSELWGLNCQHMFKAKQNTNRQI